MLRSVAIGLTGILLISSPSLADVVGNIDCHMRVEQTYRDPVSGGIIFKRGDTIGGVTGVELDLNNDTEAYCVAGGGCYPVKTNGRTILKLLNCKRTLGATIYEGQQSDRLLFDLEPITEPRSLDDRR